MPPTNGKPQAVYQSILHLSWVDKLLDNIKTLFIGLYKKQLQKSDPFRFKCNFDPYFDQQIQEVADSDDGAAGASRVVTSPGGPPPVASIAPEKDEPPPEPGLLKRESGPFSGSIKAR